MSTPTLPPGMKALQVTRLVPLRGPTQPRVYMVIDGVWYGMLQLVVVPMPQPGCCSPVVTPVLLDLPEGGGVPAGLSDVVGTPLRHGSSGTF